MEAVLLVSHGSKSGEARREIDALAGRLAPVAAGRGLAIFESAFLEVEAPTLPQGLEACARKGATRITVLLNFLNSGRHVTEHIPALVREFEAAHPGLACRLTPCLGLHPKIDELCLDLIQKGKK